MCMWFYLEQDFFTLMEMSITEEDSTILLLLVIVDTTAAPAVKRFCDRIYCF